jgi:hypothetical protein
VVILGNDTLSITFRFSTNGTIERIALSDAIRRLSLPTRIQLFINAGRKFDDLIKTELTNGN